MLRRAVEPLARTLRYRIPSGKGKVAAGGRGRRFSGSRPGDLGEIFGPKRAESRHKDMPPLQSSAFRWRNARHAPYCHSSPSSSEAPPCARATTSVRRASLTQLRVVPWLVHTPMVVFAVEPSS